MSPRLALALRVLAIAVVVALLVWFVRSLDLAALGRALANAKLWPLLVAALFNFGMLWGKAACWHVMLAPRHVVPTVKLFRYTIAAFAASAIAPARAGEVLRVWALKKRDGVPVAESTAAAVGEKLLDGVSMLILVAPLPFALPDLPPWIGYSIAGCAAIAVAAFVILYFLVGRGYDDTAERSWLRQFIGGMHVLRDSRRLAAAMAALIGVWVLDLASVMLVFYAVGIDLPVGAGLLVLFTLNLAIMLPSTPAQLGALELGAVGALEVLHVEGEPAFAFAILYHGLQVLPLIAVALAIELPLVMGRDRPPDEVEDQS
jgi:glycosyltransferase 2 family protein